LLGCIGTGKGCLYDDDLAENAGRFAQRHRRLLPRHGMRDEVHIVIRMPQFMCDMPHAGKRGRTISSHLVRDGYSIDDGDDAL